MRFPTVRKLIALFGRRSLAKGVLVLGLILASTVLEIVGIGMIFPFLQLLSNSDAALSQYWLRRAYELSAAGNPETFAGYLTAALVGLILFKGLFSVASTYVIQRITKNEQAMLSSRLVSAYLAMPWEFHIQRNSAILVRNAMKAVQDMFGDFINPLISNLADGLLVLAICGVLLAVQPFVTLLVVGILLLATVPFYGLFKEKARSWGMLAQQSEANMLQALNEGLGSLKEIKVGARESFFHAGFSKEAFAKARNYALLQTIIVVPRHFVELVMVGGMVLVIVFLGLRGEPLQNAIPTLGLFALATFRLVPPVSRLGNGFITMKYGAAAVEQIHGDVVLHGPESADASAPQDRSKFAFNGQIALDNVRFAYPGRNAPAISDVNLKIQRGQSVALVGPSGAGKSTLADLILGLIAPSQGAILVDGRNIRANLRGWQQNVGYVPQAIYLCDDSLRHNIGLGIPNNEIDENRLGEVIQLSGLTEVVNQLPNGLDTRVGERGVNLSGGQRQRIGIARALYGSPALLVLDEATSALDGISEHLIAQALESLKGAITLIVIAHRLSTIHWCERVIFLKNGTIAGSGPYEDLMATNEEFRRFVQVAEPELTT